MNKTSLYQFGFIAIISVIMLVAAPVGGRKYEQYKIDRDNRETMETIKQSDIIRPNAIQESDLTTNELVVEEGIKEKEEVKEEEIVINSEAYLEVPFICQAPLQTVENWTLHEESCEEAALLQAYLYLSGKNLSKEEANEVVLDMIEWEEENMNGHYDLYAEGMKEFAMGYYNLNEQQVRIIKDAEIEDIKNEIRAGNPIIAPITGEILQNPYYPYPGYHMLTIIGFTEDRIITNDNGTMRGADFSYDIDVFEEAYKDASGDLIIIENL
jgi:hypothetical protein